MTSYIILGGLILGFFLLLLLFRKKIFRVQDRRISAFANDIKIFLSQTYPKIPFDYSVFNQFKDEKDMNVRQVLIVEKLALQFARHEFEFTTQPPIENKLLWDSYEFESNPIKNKRPNDLRRRKEYTYKRDKQSCIRCGLKLTQDDAILATIKSFGEGGSYHFENLAILCPDCYKILKKTDVATMTKDSHILHELMKRVHF